MEIDEHLRYTFLQFDPNATNKDSDTDSAVKKRTPDYFL